MAITETERPSSAGPHRESFPLTFPEGPAARLVQTYAGATNVLEYGSGGSSFVALEQGVQSLVTVESDQGWADRIRAALLAGFPDRSFTVHHADIGPTAKWGKPSSAAAFRKFHSYATGVWDLGFPTPDVVLIDGRFRAACFATVAIRCAGPTTILFDDYARRRQYHWIEDIAKPVELVDRMAVFELEPRDFPRALMTRIAGAFTDPD